MNDVKKSFCVVIAAMLLVGGAGLCAAKGDNAADKEKAKAMAEPYANDYGPEKIDVSKYPKDVQAGYKLMVEKCSACHTAARPLHSQFVETSGKKLSDRKATLAELKKSDPDLFKIENKAVWQVEAKIWQRYVKRMMNKPGCEISKAEGKGIWKFLSYDARVRKIGKNKAKWAKFRRKLLSDFKKEHPERYKKLYAPKKKSKKKE